jgi:hypothetical protein
MKINKIISYGIALIFTASGILIATPAGKVTITEPKNMAQVDTKSKVMIMYEADAGKEGDHIHVMVDDKRENLVRQMKGHLEVGPLSAGKHKICLVINTKAHMPIGAEGCVNVVAK